jgi:hypothetical protein
LDYCAGLYNDPVVSGVFLENNTLLGSAYSEGYANQDPAIVSFGYYSPVAGQTYTNWGDHYLIAYYQVYVPYWNDWFWYDPWQIGFLEAGGGYEAPGYYGFGYAYYWFSQTIYIGSTTDSIVYCGQTQCQTGQQFSPTGVSCNFQPPSGVCGQPDPTKPRVAIKQVGFYNDHLVKELETGLLYNPNGGDADPSDDTASWTSQNGKKFPVAYTRSTKPSVWASVSVENANSSYPNISIRLKHNGQVYAGGTYNGLGANNQTLIRINIGQFTTELLNSSVTRKTDYDFTWEYSTDQINWESAGISSHTIHWLYASPKTVVGNPNSLPIFGHPGLYDKALEHSTAVLGEGTNNEIEIIGKINEHLASFLTYKPAADASNENPLNVFLESREKAAECSTNSTILVALLNSIGIDNTPNNGLTIKFYTGGNKVADIVHQYNDPIFGYPKMSGQYPRPPHDGQPLNPRFIYHSTVLFNGKSYDPSYGIIEDEVKLIEAVDVANNVPFCVTGEMANSLKITRNNEQNVPQNNYGNVCGTPSLRNSIVINQSIPSDLQIGQNYTVSITLQNTGMNTWRASEGYQLGSQNPSDNSIWGLNRVNLPHDVAPGQPVIFNFNITAPMSPGFYDFQWQMLQNGVGWFGAMTGNIPIEVIGQTECNWADQQMCYWSGGSWNQTTCTCQ